MYDRKVNHMGVHYLSMTHPHIYKLVSQTESLPQKRKIMKLKKEEYPH